MCWYQVVAEDADSHLNGAVMYSIIRGDQGKQFVIDSVSGLLKVNKQLDRETVSKGFHTRRSLSGPDSGVAVQK